MRLREHPGVKGKRDSYPFDPRLLKVDPEYNVRDLNTKEARAKLDELKEQIRHAGVRTPLEVRIQDEDVYIVAGHRRHKAVMELIEEGVEIESVLVIQEPLGTNDAERAINLVLSNSGEPLTALELARVVKRLVDFGWDEAQIAKRIGWKSKASVRQHLDMLAMPEQLQAAIKSSGIAATTARKAVEELGADATLKLIADNEKQGKKTRPRDVRAAAPPKAPKKPTPPKLPVSDIPKPEQPSALAAALQNGHAGTSEYTAPAEAPVAPEPLPTDAGVPPAASEEEPPAGASGDPAQARSDAPAAASSEVDKLRAMQEAERDKIKLTHMTNGTFFQAAAPVADAMTEQVEFGEFQPGDQIGFQISFELAAAFVAAVNQARGG